MHPDPHDPIEHLIALLARTPGMGRRSARRAVLRMLMRPAFSTVGVKARLTPNCLNWMVMLSLSSWPMGTGNSPPARKLAVSPESAVRFGSARTLIRPSRSSASMMPFTLTSPLV